MYVDLCTFSWLKITVFYRAYFLFKQILLYVFHLKQLPLFHVEISSFNKYKAGAPAVD
jgi:hypothetical protein